MTEHTDVITILYTLRHADKRRNVTRHRDKRCNVTRRCVLVPELSRSTDSAQNQHAGTILKELFRSSFYNGRYSADSDNIAAGQVGQHGSFSAEEVLADFAKAPSRLKKVCKDC
ncbi:hypothetical protein BaRGS_00035750 [Batillaria attramentaria]|uniref:Uncharacterized protein n=1 Tax=Batillaria attramentaria TaxID=370345 RepID=A0ABD0JDP9_9CAEN